MAADLRAGGDAAIESQICCAVARREVTVCERCIAVIHVYFGLAVPHVALRVPAPVQFLCAHKAYRCPISGRWRTTRGRNTYTTINRTTYRDSVCPRSMEPPSSLAETAHQWSPGPADAHQLSAVLPFLCSPRRCKHLVRSPTRGLTLLFQL